MNKNLTTTQKLLLACGGCLVFGMLVFVCLSAAGLVAYFYWGDANIALLPTETVAPAATDTSQPVPSSVAVLPGATPTEPPSASATQRPTFTAVPLPTPLPATATPTPLPLDPPNSIVQLPVPTRAWANLERLFDTDYPPHDYFDTANRLGRRNLTARTVDAPVYQVGDTQTFFTDEGSIEATLVAATEHAYFWVEKGLNLDETAVAAAATRLENEYYPLLTGLFGEEWQPGVDNDPHFSILHLRLPLDAPELGYFSAIDEYPRDLFSDSNEQEMVYLNMAAMNIDDDIYDGTLVHELQHLIQWHVDANEAAWLNEGLSQMAELYVGLETADATPYLLQPDIRLNTWEYEEDVVDAHYAGSYLLSVYLWEQLGERAMQELARHPANGMAAIRSVLEGYDSRTLEEFMADWAVANYLDDPSGGRTYNYSRLDLAQPALQKRIRQLPETRTDTLNQYGVHYFEINSPGDVAISFAGDTLIGLTSSPPPAGSQIWMAPAQDETNANLTIPFDLTDVDQATLQFQTWYSLEPDWDFAYVSISEDEGASWTLLVPDEAAAGEFGPAFNGRSADVGNTVQGWYTETISLNSYIDREVQIRFEVLTDYAITGQGFAVANVQVPELGFAGMLETAVAPRDAHGFVHIDWQIPQQWQLRLIHLDTIPRIEVLPLNTLNQVYWETELGKGGAILVITALSPFTEEPASYWLDIR